MPNLSDLIEQKLAAGDGIEESNLEKGEVWSFQPSTRDAQFGVAATACMCWNAPGSGTAVIEIWGASGSSGKMCCCGAGIPGNPGAYAKKTIQVDSSTWIRGIIGNSCSNDSLCFKGCSQATCVTLCSPNGTLPGGLECNCLCAEGGAGGVTWCNGSTQPYCCHRGNGMCASLSVNCNSGNACGNVCHVGFFTGRCAYGGDINCNSGDPNFPESGMFSCVQFHSCYPCKCAMKDTVTVAPGIFSTEPSSITYQRACYSNNYDGTGDGGSQILGGLAALGRRAGNGGIPNAQCWSSHRPCGCYEDNHCGLFLPPGVPGQASMTAGSVRDYGWRGGPGKVRIKFIGAS